MNTSYYRKILVLASGTGLAQLINIASLPILTRIYSPEEYGWFVLYSAAVAILTLFATLKYENHILLAEDITEARDSANLVNILSILACFLFAVLGISLQSYLDYELELLNLIAIGVMIAGWQLSSYYYLNRQAKYNVMSMARVLAALVFLLSALFLNFLFPSVDYALLWSSLMGVMTSVIYMTSNDKGRVFNFYNSIRLFSKESSYYRIILPSNLLDVMSSQFPIIIGEGVYSTDKIGNFGIYNKCVSLPSSILGKAVADVFKQEVFELLKNGKTAIAVYLGTAKKLAIIGLLPYLILQFFGSQIFSFVLGEKWSFAGEIAEIMAIHFYLGFVVTPLSNVLYFSDYKKWDLVIQIISALAIAITLFQSYLRLDFIFMIKGITVSYVIKYLLQFCAGYAVVSREKEYIS